MAETAMNAAGSAAKENARTVDSLQGRLNALIATAQEFASTFMESDLLKGLTSGATAALDVLTKIIDTFGTIGTLMGVLAGVLTFTGFKNIMPFSVNVDKSLAKATDQVQIFGQSISKVQKSLKNIGSGKGFSLAKVFGDNTVRLSGGVKEKLVSDLSALKKAYKDGNADILKQTSDAFQKYAKQTNLSSSLFDADANVRAKAYQGAQEYARKMAKIEETAIQATSKSFKERATAINTFNEMSADSQKAVANQIMQTDKAAGKYFTNIANGANKGKAGMVGLTIATGAARVATIGLQVAAMAANMALTMGIGLLVTKLFELADAAYDTKEEVAEMAQEAVSAFENQKSAADNAKKTIDEVGAAYAKLSSGGKINPNTGENLTLSTEEYQEYLNAANQIADVMPSLVQGYDEQGNAILNCAGDLSALNDEYERLAKLANDELISKAGDIFETFQNQAKEFSKDKGMSALSDLLSSENIDETLKKYTEFTEADWEMIETLGASDPTGMAAAGYINNTNQVQSMKGIAKLLEDAGIERNGVGNWNPFDDESYEDYLERVLNDPSLKSIYESIVSTHEREMEAAADDMRTVTSAYLSNAFLGDDYDDISTQMQSMIGNIASNLDYEFFAGFLDENGEFQESEFYNTLDKVLKSFNELGTEHSRHFEVFADLETRYNNGEVSIDEYLKGFDNINKAIDLLPEEIRETVRIMLGLDVNEVEADKTSLVTRLNEEVGMALDVANEFAGSLTSGEMQIVVDLLTQGKIDRGMVDDFEKLVEEMKSKGLELGDVMKETWGNIDLGDSRGVLEWTDENLDKYKDAIMSWEAPDAKWDDVRKSMENSFSTVLGAYEEFNLDGTVAKEGGKIKIAFSPMLQTESGLELLSRDTVNKYMDGLIDMAMADDGKVDKLELLSFDMTGLEIDGHKVNNIIAAIGENAEEVSEIMHYMGAEGAYESLELLKLITRELEVQAALNYQIDMTYETESMEALNTALSETMSATGVTAESMSALNSRYASLEAQGYDLSDMFDATSVGLRLNTEAISEFEHALNTHKLEETTGHLETLEEELSNVEATIADANATASNKSAAIARRDEIIEQMNLLGQQAAMYRGLTSAYAEWQNAEAAGQNRDMYETVLEGHDTVKDELSRGWGDDATVKYLELLTGRSDLAGKSVKELRGVFNDLDNAINDSGISINDFFTVDSEGNSTAKGFYNFLDAINAEAGKIGDAVTKHSDGSYTFDFEVAGGDKAIAEALGISEELVHIMLQAGKDAGFEINFEGKFEHFSKIVTSAEEAMARFNEECNEGQDIDFDFGSSNIETVKSDLDDAIVLLEQYREADGTIITDKNKEGYKAGAAEALEMATTLQTAYDRLNNPVYMSIDASEVESELQEPLEMLQEYDSLLANRNNFALKGDKTSQAYKDNEEAMKNTFKYFKKIRDEGGALAKSLEIDGMSDEELQDALNNQTIKIPGVLDLTASMDDSLNKLVDIAMWNAGFKDSVEIPWMFEAETGAKIDGLDLSKYGLDEQEIALKFVKDNKDILNTLNNDERSFVVDFYMQKDNRDMLNLLSEDQLKIAIEFIAKNKDFLSQYDEKQQRVIVEFQATHSKLLESLDDGQKSIVYDFVAKNPEFLEVIKTYGEEEQLVLINFIAKNADILNKYEDEEQKILYDLSISNPDIFNDVLGNLSNGQRELVFDLLVRNPELVDKYTKEQWPVIVEFLAANPDFMEKYTDPVTQKIVLDYVAENGIEAWNELGVEGQEAIVKIVADDSELKDWKPEQIEAMVKYIVDGGDVEGWTPEMKQAFAQYLVDGGDVEGWSPEAKYAFAKYLVDGGDPAKFNPEDKESWVVYDTNTTKPDSYNADKNATVTYDKNSAVPDGYNPNKSATVTYDKNSSVIEAYNPDKHSIVKFDKDTSLIDTWKPVVTGVAQFTLSMLIPDSIRTSLSKIGISIADGTANSDGTAHADGTAFANGTIKSGKAFRRGDWGVKQTETALTGELGQELVVYGNRYWTVGDNGAEFATIPKGAIVFNHKQTEELFKNGKVTSGGGRGRFYANGTAFAGGSFPTSGLAFNDGGSYGSGDDYAGDSSGTSKSSKSSSSSSSSSDSADEFEETLDLIEIMIDRIERAISRLDLKASSVYQKWATRNNALVNQINKVREEISLQERAYTRYMQEAASVGLSSDWVDKIQNGRIDITTITDESLKEKIDEYQEWYFIMPTCLTANM